MKKYIFGFLLSVSLLASYVTIVDAETIKTTTYSWTSGPDNIIKITAKGYVNHSQPIGSVHAYTYGVRAYTSSYGYAFTNVTQFNIEMKLVSNNTMVPVNKSVYGEICDNYTTRATAYQSVNSVVSTESSAFGTSTQYCNYVTGF